jgi:hypothetical protein
MRKLILFIFLGFLMVDCSKESNSPEPPEPPGTPSGLSSLNSELTSITLTWNSVDKATGYRLYHSANDTVDFEPVYDGPNTIYIDTNLIYATSYYYKVSAINEDGESILSEAISSSTKIPNAFLVSGFAEDTIAFVYKEMYNGKPCYEAPWYTSLNITTLPFGDENVKDHWVLYDYNGNILYYYHPDITPYPYPTGWLTAYDNSPADILLSPRILRTKSASPR